MRFIQKFVFFVFLVIGSASQAEVYDVSTTAELREALASAAAAGGDNTIRLAAGTYSTQDDGEGVFVYLSRKEATLLIKALDSSVKPVLSGINTDGILSVSVEGQLIALTVQALEFQESSDSAVRIVQGCGGLDVVDSSFSDNTGTGRGGVIQASTCESLRIHNSAFSRNYGSERGSARGGAVYLAGLMGPLTIENSVFFRQ